jgi:hypothetical protein
MAVVAAVAATALAAGTAGVVSASDGSGSSAASGSSSSVAGKGGEPQAGMGMRFGTSGPGRGQQGVQQMRADAPMSAPSESGVLTAQQRADLSEMAQEEKLAHDLYVAFAALYDDQRFDNIASAETQHLAAVRSVLTSYDIADPTLGTAQGEFTSAQWQGLYSQLLARGSSDLAAALEAGATVERTDIADLQAAITDLNAPDVEQVYSHLLSGSQMHLQAFTR